MGCEDKITKWDLIVNITPDNSGIVVNDVAKDTLNGSYDYEDNTELTIVAVPELGWEFSHWEGDLSGSENPTTIVMDSNKSITAVFVKLQYSLSITIIGDGEVTEEIVAAKTTDYDHGSTIQLTAMPDTGWEFSHWEGDLSGSENPATIIMDGDKSLTAVFIQIPYNIILTIRGNGTVTKNPDQSTYFYNSSVQLTATPETGWTFDHWEGDLAGSTNPINLTIEGNITAEAIFVQLHTLTTDVVGNGTISQNPNSATYKHNMQVQLTANADPGWTFDHWEGDLAGSINPTSITMDDNKSITAVFTEDHILTINVDGNGSVTRNPNSSAYIHNTQVQLTANADPGWTFDHWEGDLAGSTNPTSITMDDNKSITAVFTQNQYNLTININGSGTVALNPNQASYIYNQEVELTASPSAQSLFTNWTGDLNSSSNPVMKTIIGNTVITANFIDIANGLNSSFGACVTIAGYVYQICARLYNVLPVGVVVNKIEFYDSSDSYVNGTSDPSYLNNNWLPANSYMMVGLSYQFGQPPSRFSGWKVKWYCSYNGFFFNVIGHYGLGKVSGNTTTLHLVSYIIIESD